MPAFLRSLKISWALMLVSGFLASSIMPAPAVAAHGGHGGQAGHAAMSPAGGHMGFNPGGGHMGGVPMGNGPGGGHTNNINFSPGIFYGYGAAGPYVYSPSLAVVGGGGFAPAYGIGFQQGFVPFGMGMGMGVGGAGGGLNLPMPPVGLFDQPQPRARRANPARSKELLEIGDRSFRGHNIKRAEEKFNLAVKADPSSPTPHVHLAQVSLSRGNYAAAADHLRDAVTVAADGAWLLTTPDIQAIFAEPADFAKQLARLETHLQANPNDRDAWFVLGAETYLSGRSRQAFDVFQRLTDRRSDEALTAFLDASKPRPAAAN